MDKNRRQGIFGLRKVREQAMRKVIAAESSDREAPEHHVRDYLLIRTATDKQVSLQPCQVNGEPTSMIVFVERDTDPESSAKWQLRPMFVAVTAEMDLRDKDGVSPHGEPEGKGDGLSTDDPDRGSPKGSEPS